MENVCELRQQLEDMRTLAEDLTTEILSAKWEGDYDKVTELIKMATPLIEEIYELKDQIKKMEENTVDIRVTLKIDIRELFRTESGFSIGRL